ncbi:MAG TPA: hypothetical protein VFP96_15630, partial [Candidatus Acidoferrum sp.]|nr:hypothetical protein [Candidatus Acidoferrum sp.]
MPARNCNAASVVGSRKKESRQSKLKSSGWLLRALLVCAVGLGAEINAQAQEPAATKDEVRQLRQEVNELQASVKRLEALLTAKIANPAGAAPAESAQTAPAGAQPSAASSAPASREKPAQEVGIDQYTGR